MDSNGPNIVHFVFGAAVFFVLIVVALAWGYGRLSARNRKK